jgi:hypothetical protein
MTVLLISQIKWQSCKISSQIKQGRVMVIVEQSTQCCSIKMSSHFQIHQEILAQGLLILE